MRIKQMSGGISAKRRNEAEVNRARNFKYLARAYRARGLYYGYARR